MKKLNNKCDGCGVCSIICPTKAIDIILNENGFYERKINKKRCINCGLCEDICLNKKNNIPNLNINKNYVASVRDENVLKNSSSGGLSYIISKIYLNLGYTICGVQYNSDKQRAEHIIINNQDDLKKIQGSKYLQSYTKLAFSEMVKLDKCVVFATPCQIAGLHILLEKLKKRKNFILIDIFCHGVGSYLIFNNHLKYLCNKNKIKINDPVLFRNKKKYVMSIGNSYKKSYQVDGFMYMYLRNIFFNDSCYDCNYRRKSFSDIRLGDYSSKKYDKLDYNPSSVIINTNKGIEVLDNIKDSINIYEKSFFEIDSMQDKSNKIIPKSNKKIISLLKKGFAPNEILRKELFIGNIKYSIKYLLNKNTKFKLNLKDVEEW